MWSGALDSSGFLLSYRVISLASPINIILISTLKHTYLYAVMQNNRFTRFPIELHQCKTLRKLDLRNNAIMLLPRAIDKMSNLTYLDLSRNLLRALPVEFTGVLETVEDVGLDGNPWNDLPERWGRLWTNKHATDGPGGYAVADAVDFLYVNMLICRGYV